MSQIISKDRKIFAFSLITAAATIIAGIIHLQMVPGSISHNMGEGILFLVGGLVQIFWAVPIVKRWGKIWQIIGLVGTGVFFLLWLLDRLHLMPEVNVFGGETYVPREFPQGNMTGGEFPRGSAPGGFPQGARPAPLGFQVGKILVPPIELFQFAFIGLYAYFAKMISRRP